MLVYEEESREAGIAQRYHDEPRRGDSREQRQARARVQPPPGVRVTLGERVEDERSCREHPDDDSLGEHRQGARPPGGEHPAALGGGCRRGALRQGESQHRGRQPEGEAAVQQVEMADDHEERTDGERRQGQQRAVAPVQARHPGKHQRQARERQPHAPQPRAPLLEAECPVRRGRRPVLQRRLFEVLQAIEPWSDPVTAREHLARDLGVTALVGIEERAHLEGREPGGAEDDPRPPAEPAAAPPLP